mmetsp:Transcript_29912/g.86069  ORF Transcript_29912/g.86069 Transcript_29912/m.86069 type:complete len:256 (-) Transcript_29912:881-1648(-)
MAATATLCGLKSMCHRPLSNPSAQKPATASGASYSARAGGSAGVASPETCNEAALDSDSAGGQQLWGVPQPSTTLFMDKVLFVALPSVRMDSVLRARRSSGSWTCKPCIVNSPISVKKPAATYMIQSGFSITLYIKGVPRATTALATKLTAWPSIPRVATASPTLSSGAATVNKCFNGTFEVREAKFRNTQMRGTIQYVGTTAMSAPAAVIIAETGSMRINKLLEVMRLAKNATSIAPGMTPTCEGKVVSTETSC